MRNKKQKILPQISFFDAGAKGVALGKAQDGKMVMVKNAIPGDVADVRVFKKRKNYYLGNAENFSVFSEDRVTPKCDYFGLCGGCKWQQMKYPKQLEFKEKEVINNIQRIAKIQDFEQKSILGSSKDYFYRNKMEFSFSNQRWLSEKEIQNNEIIEDKNALGFHPPGLWSKIIDIEKCYLQEDPSNEIRNFVRKWTLDHKIPYFDLKNHAGVLRTMMLRNNHLGEWMLVFQFYQDFEKRVEFLDRIQAQFPQIKSLGYAINPKANDSIYDLKIINHSGKEFLWESMNHLKFKISPKSFFQTNYHQAVNLYELSRKYANLSGNEIVYDLYTGTGTIALFIAENAKKVIGIESVAQAIEDAKENAKINGIENCEFFCGDMKDLFTSEFVQLHGKPDALITDPPRDGMHKKVVAQILELAPKRIVYVSCNSATQARDIELLKEKYELQFIHPVDMFPQTHHVENIAVLELK